MRQTCDGKQREIRYNANTCKKTTDKIPDRGAVDSSKGERKILKGNAMTKYNNSNLRIMLAMRLYLGLMRIGIKQLAEDCGTSPSSMRRFISGNDVSHETVLAVCEWLVEKNGYSKDCSTKLGGHLEPHTLPASQETE